MCWGRPVSIGHIGCASVLLVMSSAPGAHVWSTFKHQVMLSTGHSYWVHICTPFDVVHSERPRWVCIYAPGDILYRAPLVKCASARCVVSFVGCPCQMCNYVLGDVARRAPTSGVQLHAGDIACWTPTPGAKLWIGHPHRALQLFLGRTLGTNVGGCCRFLGTCCPTHNVRT